MRSTAVLLQEPESLALAELMLRDPGADDIVVETEWSGISSGTERLLWTGEMPPFPGLGYPLVPGYESVGRVVEVSGVHAALKGRRVFVPGSHSFPEVRSLFGATAQHLVCPGARVVAIDDSLAEQGTLLALAATAYHAVAGPGARPPMRIVGHGVLGRLIARVSVALGAPPPVVWEREASRMDGAVGYEVADPSEGLEKSFDIICDASGDGNLLDPLIARLSPGGEIVLAGFYRDRLSFSFPPAFMREARLRIAAEWKPADLAAVSRLVAEGRLSLDGLITDMRPVSQAAQAYRTAFEDRACLKMLLCWSDRA
jgi:3-hydroxyethyl bacteriochlorophyllide a dehydrogenase